MRKRMHARYAYQRCMSFEFQSQRDMPYPTDQSQPLGRIKEWLTTAICMVLRSPF